MTRSNRARKSALAAGE